MCVIVMVKYMQVLANSAACMTSSSYYSGSDHHGLCTLSMHDYSDLRNYVITSLVLVRHSLHNSGKHDSCKRDHT